MMKIPCLNLRLRFRVSFGLAGAAAVLLGALGAHGAPQVKAAPPVAPRIGEFKILNADLTQYRVAKVGFRLLLTGPKLLLTSARYDLAAPKIVAYVTAGKPQTIDATGRAHIAVRVPEQKQNSTLDCDSARYVAGKNGANTHIYAVGSVRTVTRTPDLTEPLVSQSKTADIELLPNGEYNITLNQTSAQVTPREKPTAPRPKKP